MFEYRTATLADAELLLLWRNDKMSRESSHNTKPVDLDSHMKWLASSISSPTRKLYIASIDNLPIGTVRLDYLDGESEISWTVAPSARGRGFGKRMVGGITETLTHPIKATVMKGNTASVKIARSLGMAFLYEESQILFYRKP